MAPAAPAAPTVAIPDLPIPLALPETDEDLIDVEDAEVPLAVAEDDDTDDMDGQDLVEVEDAEVPLADASVTDSVKHCIFHFFELLLAVAVGVYGVVSTKKQKLQIEELENGHDGDGKRG